MMLITAAVWWLYNNAVIKTMKHNLNSQKRPFNVDHVCSFSAPIGPSYYYLDGLEIG